MKRFFLMVVLAIGCGGMEMGEAEAAPLMLAAATCGTVTHATARFCRVAIAAGSCSVVSGPCGSCTLAANSLSVVFDAPIALTQALQIFNLPKNVYTPPTFAASCSAAQTISWATVPTSGLVGTVWTLTDQNPDKP